jgi:V/A-type H+-transporting ATPase subunit D
VPAEHTRKTSRRVNAPEQRMLPSLREQISFIRDTLDQREREDTFRLKRLKKKKSRSKNEGLVEHGDISPVQNINVR